MYTRLVIKHFLFSICWNTNREGNTYNYSSHVSVNLGMSEIVFTSSHWFSIL